MTIDEVVRKTSIKLLQVGEALGIRNLDPEPGKIFITGGTGVVGHRVAKKLLEAGYHDVRLASHRPDESLEEWKKLGAEVVADFAWDSEETYAEALHGVKSVLCTNPCHADWKKHFPAFLKACEKAGVRHFLKMSFYHARVGDVFQEVPLVRDHGECDEMLIKDLTPSIEAVEQGDTDVSFTLPPHMGYTILYASHFMSNPFTFQGKELHDSMKPSTFYGASGNHGVNYVSPNDIAGCCVKILLEPKPHYNQEYTLTGPEAITDQQVAGLLSKHLKHPVMYVDQPLHTYMTKMQDIGDPEWMVSELAALEKVKATGNEENLSFISGDVEKICGHKPQAFEEYLQATDAMTKVERGPSDEEPKPMKEAPAATA